MTLPVASVSMPGDLRTAHNGQLPGTILVPVDGGGQLHHLAARGFAAMKARAGGAGLDLTFTYGGCYRSYNQQEDLFRARYTTSILPGRPTKIWQGVRWYLRPAMAMAAVPGSSNHGWGLAIDLAIGAAPQFARPIRPAMPWLLANVRDFGFSWETQEEEWHVRYVRGDQVPQDVLDFERIPAQPASDVEQVPQEDQMATVRVHVAGRFAEFWTQCPIVNGQPDILWLLWSGPGGSNYDRFAVNHGANGVVEIITNLDVLRANIMLIGDPTQIEDSQAPGGHWSTDDFFRVA